MKKHVDVLLKDAKKFGKEELSLGEKKKHLAAKQKKLKKTLSEVSSAISMWIYNLLTLCLPSESSCPIRSGTSVRKSRGRDRQDPQSDQRDGAPLGKGGSRFGGSQGQP